MALLLRIAAIALLVAAFVPYRSTGHERVLVIGLEGASRAQLEAMMTAGGLPVLQRLVAGARTWDLIGSSRRDPGGFWRAVFRADGSSRYDPSYLWSPTTAPSDDDPCLVIGVVGIDELVSDGHVLLAGADETIGFIGDNTGTVVSDVALARGRLGWPYAPLNPVAELAIPTLAPGDASPWIPVYLADTDDRSGVYRIYRVDDDHLYLTPVYRRTRLAREFVDAPEDLVYVPDDPAWTMGGDTEVAGFYYAHVRDLTADRSELARRLIAERDWRMSVYVDRMLWQIAHAYAVEEAEEDDDAFKAVGGVHGMTAELTDAYREVDERVGALVTAAGPGTAVVLVGTAPDVRPGSSEEALLRRAPIGFAYLSGGGSGGIAGTVSDLPLADLAGHIARLLESASSNPRDDAERARPLPARVSAGRQQRIVPLTARSMSDLGLLKGSASAPADDDGDASALSRPTSSGP